jgi:cytochrome oxidase Cu insertion factor (SCO1/SenC/PrrC family)
MNHRIFRIGLISIVALLALLALAWQWGLLAPTNQRSGISGIAQVGGPFTLVDQDGKTRTDRDFAGRLMLTYFGYSFCPDVCPTALQVMSTALQTMGDDAKQVQPIFITVDPARDTPKQLKDYVSHFFPGTVGLTGSEEQISNTAKAYRVYYRKAEDGSTAEYLMDHSSIVFLMGRDGAYLTHFTHQTTPAKMAEAIRKYL